MKAVGDLRGIAMLDADAGPGTNTWDDDKKLAAIKHNFEYLQGEERNMLIAWCIQELKRETLAGLGLDARVLVDMLMPLQDEESMRKLLSGQLSDGSKAREFASSFFNFRKQLRSGPFKQGAVAAPASGGSKKDKKKKKFRPMGGEQLGYEVVQEADRRLQTFPRERPSSGPAG